MNLMPIEQIPDWEQRIARQDAFWHCAVLDRPVVVMTAPKPEPGRPWPAEKTYAAIRDRWMDAERVVEEALAAAANIDYFGDALPTAWPNLGPEVFSAFYGMDMEYSRDTSWGVPCLADWAEADRLEWSRDNFYFGKIEAMTRALIEAGQGRYYVGLTDLHPGGDALAAFRDPQQLATDLLFYPDAVKRLLDRVTRDYCAIYDHFHGLVTAAGHAVTAWLGIVSSKKWYVPSNDFSCMVSEAMFEEFFLPGIAAECRHMEASAYHLDGPGALRHLDALLDIPELNAIQWVYGAGQGRATDWLEVYKKCQNAGKGVHLGIDLDELETIIAHLRPEGVWMSVAVPDQDAARAVLKRVETWT